MKNTPLSPAVMKAMIELEAPDLSANQVANLLAHISIETRSGKSLKQYNFGNLTIAKSNESNVLFWRPPWYGEQGADASARNKRLHTQMLAGKAPSAFAAYRTGAAGMRKYLSRMRGRYSPMLRAATPREYVQEWRDTGYTPGLDVEATLPNFEHFVEQYGGTSSPSQDARGLVWPWLIAAGVGLWVLKKSG